MATSLTVEVNSETQRAQNMLAPASAPTQIVVYVEGKSDIPFWNNILYKYEKSLNVKFDVEPISLCNKDGQRENVSGKSAIWKFINHTSVGPFLIVAVDSDYDYLLDDPHLESKFVLHTFTYSIENHQCHAKNLTAVVCRARNDSTFSFDFEAILKSYSEIIYETLLWAILLKKKGHPLNEEGKGGLREKIRIENPTDVENQFRHDLQLLKTEFPSEPQNLYEHSPDYISEKNTLKETLSAKGLVEENAYLFAQGHSIKNAVVLPLLHTIVSKLKYVQNKEIRENFSGSEIEIEIAKYEAKCVDLETALNAMPPHPSCPLAKLLFERVSEYISELSDDLASKH
jgi:hypothetical protein